MSRSSKEDKFLGTLLEVSFNQNNFVCKIKYMSG